MISCGCGSTDFIVEYQTTARLRLTDGHTASVAYGPVSESGVISTVTCDGCSGRLDIDNTLRGAAQESLFAFLAARYQGDNIAASLPSLTVRTRTAATEPLASPRPRHNDGCRPTGAPNTASSDHQG